MFTDDSIEGADRVPLPRRAIRGRRGWGSTALRAGRWFVGQRFAHALDEMERAQWMAAEELQNRTDRRLAALLRHAAAHVAFYRDIYQRLGLAPDALSTTDDLIRLPVVSKSTHRRLPADQFLAQDVPSHRRLERTTSGTTGEPFTFCLDRGAVPWIFASHFFYDSWCGLQPFDRYIRVVFPPLPDPPLGPDAPRHVRFAQRLGEGLKHSYDRLTQRYVSVWEVTPERAEEVRQRIEEFRPRFVLGYTSTLALVADELLKRNRPLGVPLDGIITIAEALSAERRHVLHTYFKAPITNRYGLREFGSWSAQSCGERPEEFHVNSELVACEILRPDGTPALPGETGRIVLTDLHNYAMPMIRYDTGDLGAIDERAECACGRGFPRLKRLEGRSQDCVKTTSGHVISPLLLGDYMWLGGPSFEHSNHKDAIEQYQLIQVAPDRVRMHVVPGSTFDKTRQNRLHSDLGRLLGKDMSVTIETVTEIPLEKSGKRCIIKNMCQSGGTGATPPPAERLTSEDEHS